MPLNARESLSKSARSFGPALRGLQYFVRTENNARFHIIASVLAIVLALALQISALEWCVIITQIGFVWAAEVFNTAIERTVDYVSLDRNPKAGAIKDLAATAVLVASFTALVTGIIIFAPKFFG